MTTSDQVDANRRNAKLSSGPKTKAGKAAASKNALKHGMLSKEALLPGESAADYEKLIEELYVEHKPVGPTECALVGRMGDGIWRLERFRKSERDVYVYQQANSLMNSSFRRRLQTVFGDDIGPELQGELYVSSQDSLAKLSRYETFLERIFYKALHELQRLQAARKGQYVPPPQVAEVNVTTMNVGSADSEDRLHGPVSGFVDVNSTHTPAPESGDKALLDDPLRGLVSPIGDNNNSTDTPAAASGDKPFEDDGW